MTSFKKVAIGLAAIALPVAAVLLFAAGPWSSTLRPPERQGEALLVKQDGEAQLWVLLKQEESRQVSYGFGSRGTGGFRTDALFHFDLQAHDVRTTQPAWKKHLLTLGDPEAGGSKPSRVIGSSAGGRLLGQDGGIVWAVVADRLVGLSIADGSVKADAAALEQRNAALKGLMPTSPDLYAFDAGLLVTAADAQRYRVDAATLAAVPWQPPPARPPATCGRCRSASRRCVR